MILPVAIVTLAGTGPDLRRDLDAANLIWGNDCEVWIEIVDTIVVNRPELLVLSQEDCRGVGHVVSDEEDELFAIGRDLGSDVVGYYIQSSSSSDSLLGCAAHPPGRRGFWVRHDTTLDFVWAHELGHVVGDNPHIPDSDNLMHSGSLPSTNLPLDLNEEQCRRIVNDPALLSVESIALNL
ncbi:MAG: hypothetical protein NPIRA02_41780 [Nitrospirales bacterium]|nr:MAG: hypothetical protein NPIRA02_41780 [Nitrospirales bacterium]